MPARRAVLSLSLSALAIACGGDEASVSLNIAIHGPDDGPDSNTIGFPVAVDADVTQLRFRSFQGTRLVDETIAGWDDRPARLPSLAFGRESWIAVEALDDADNVLASGATPRFKLRSSDSAPPLQMLTLEQNVFRPAFYWRDDGESDPQSAPLVYDSAGAERAGHSVTSLLDGSGAVVIGGAKIGPAGTGFAESGVTAMVDTIEHYDAVTGQFLTVWEPGCDGGDDECALRLPGGGVAWHTATALPDGRVVIAGGLRIVEQAGTQILRPTANAYVLTLEGHGSGYLDPLGGDGVDRAFHTATLIPDGRVILIGGIANTFVPEPGFQRRIDEVDADATAVSDSGAELNIPRAWHTATWFGDDEHGIIVVGGIGGADTPLGTSEVVYRSGEGLEVEVFSADNAARDLQVARFGHSAVEYSCPGDDRSYLAIVGGFTTAGANLLAGGSPTGTVEYYLPHARFDEDALYRYDTAQVTLANPGRGFGAAVRLPISEDVLFIGGMAGDGSYPAVADRLQNIWDCAPADPDDAHPAHERADAVPGLAGGRGHAGAVVLPNGFVLVSGGATGTASTELNEFYNPGDYSLLELPPYN